MWNALIIPPPPPPPLFLQPDKPLPVPLTPMQKGNTHYHRPKYNPKPAIFMFTPLKERRRERLEEISSVQVARQVYQGHVTRSVSLAGMLNPLKYNRNPFCSQLQAWPWSTCPPCSLPCHGCCRSTPLATSCRCHTLTYLMCTASNPL